MLFTNTLQYLKLSNDQWEDLIDSGILTDPDDTTTEWVDKLVNTLRHDAEINSN
jgi:hypothetical protein